MTAAELSALSDRVAVEVARLRWVKAHHLVCYFSDFTGESPETGIRPWTCSRMDNPGEVLTGRAGIGDTQDEACADYATKHGIKLWNEQEI